MILSILLREVKYVHHRFLFIFVGVYISHLQIGMVCIHDTGRKFGMTISLNNYMCSNCVKGMSRGLASQLLGLCN